MSGFTTWHIPVPSLPDGRLARAVASPRGIVFEHDMHHVDAKLLRDVGEFSRHLARSGLYVLDLSHLGDRPSLNAFITLVPVHLMPELCLFTVRRGTVDRTPFLEYRIRADKMSAEIARELNEWVIPGIRGAIRPCVPDITGGDPSPARYGLGA
jgi:hypothetical protein